MNLRDLCQKTGLSADVARGLLEREMQFLPFSETVPFSPEEEAAARRLLQLWERSAPQLQSRPKAHPRAQPAAGTGFSARTEAFLREAIRRDYLLFIDTCSLLEPASALFLKRLSAMLRKYGAKLCIARSVCMELDKRSRIPATAAKVEAIRPVIGQMNREGLICYVGNDEDDSFFDGTFLQQLIGFRCKSRNVLLITQDGNETRDIYLLDRLASIRTTSVFMAQKINSSGNLEDAVPELPCPAFTQCPDYSYNRTKKG